PNYQPGRTARAHAAVEIDNCRFHAGEIDCGRGSAAGVGSVKAARGEGEENSANITDCSERALDGARVAVDARKPWPAGRANSARLERSRTARATANHAGTQHSRTLRHQRNAGLARQRARGVARVD